MTEGSTSLHDGGEKKAVPWLIQYAPLLLTVVVVVVFVVVRAVTWPDAPRPANMAIADGFIIVAEETPDGVMLSYGFELPDGSRVYDEVPVGKGEGDANVAYGWQRQGAGSLILVAYDASDPYNNLPYLEFPYWGTGSWATLIASVLLPVAIWLRRRLYPATAPASEDQQSPSAIVSQQ